MACVELRRISKVFSRGVVALREVDLEVRDSEILVLLGPNGSGKTTLLRLIAGLERPTSGEIHIRGRNVAGLAPRQRNVAMVFQGSVLYPHLTAEQNIAFGPDRVYGGWAARVWNWLTSLAGIANAAARARVIRERVRHTAHILGVEHLLDRYPRQLSGGECQRVALGRALVRQPAVFLLDEPWANVDRRARQQLRIELQKLRQQCGGPMVLVTHDHVEALAVGDRIAVLDQGRLHQVGSPAEILEDPQTRFVAEFVGQPPMNFVAGELKAREGGLEFESPLLRLRFAGRDATHGRSLGPNQAVWLGFRADEVVVQTQAVAGAAALHAKVVGTELVADAVHVLVSPVADGAQSGADGPLVVKSANDTRLHPGQDVWLLIDPDQSLWFDLQSENRIYLGLEAKSK